MKKIFISLIVSILSLTACSKKDPTTFEDANGIKFQYGTPKSPDIAASYKDNQIPMSMIISQSAPLAEMFLLENDYLLTKAFEQAAEIAKEGKKVSLKFFLPLSGKLDVIMAKHKLVKPKNMDITLEKTGSPSVVASVNERSFSKSDLAPVSIQLASFKHREITEVVNRVKGVVIRGEYAKLANEAKQPLEQYLKTNVYPKDLSPSADETATFIKESNLSEPDLTDEVKKKVAMIIEERKRNALLETHFADKIQREPIMIYLAPEQLELISSQSLDSVWGYKDAPVHIQMFSDLNCAPCLELLKAVIAVEDKYSGQVRVSFNHYFNEQDRSASLMAEAASCAYDQSKKGFKKFVGKVANGGVLPEEESIYKTATESGLSADGMKTCLVGRKQTSLINDHLRFAKSSGVRAMPTIIIGGNVIEGPISQKVLDKMVKDQVAVKGDPWFTVMIRKIKGLFGS